MSETLPQNWEDSFTAKQVEVLDLIRSMWTNAYNLGQAAGGGSGQYSQEDLDNAVATAVGAEKAAFVAFLEAELADDQADRGRLEAKLAELNPPSEPEPAA